MYRQNLSVAMLSYHQNNGGAAIACNRLVEALRNQGVSVTHIVQEAKDSENLISTTRTFWDKLGNFYRFVKERLAFYPHEKNKSIRYLFNPGFYGKDLSKHPAVLAADIIHLHHTNFGFLSTQNIADLCKLGKPVVWTMHDMWAFTGGCHHSGICENYQSKCGFCTEFIQKPAINDLSNLIWKQKNKAYKHTNLYFIACSNWLRLRALKSSLLKHKQVDVIPNTLDTVQIFVPKHKNDAKLALGLGPKPLLLFVAVRPNAPKKGFLQFIESIQKLPESLNIQIGIVGNVIDKSAFDLLNKPVHYFGYVDDSRKMAEIYQAADLYVTTSLEENLPNTIMEAMACGTPCVGFEVGGIPEMIKHQENGYLAKCFDTSDFSKGITDVLFRAEAYGKKARMKVETSFCEELVTQKHISFYQYCLNQV